MVIRKALVALASAGLVLGSTAAAAAPVAVDGVRAASPVGESENLGFAWIIGIHQLEANVLNPKIMGDAAKVHPVLVIFALIAGEHFFGIVGALLAVPVLSVVQSLFLHFREVALGIPSAIRTVPPATAVPP